MGNVEGETALRRNVSRGLNQGHWAGSPTECLLVGKSELVCNLRSRSYICELSSPSREVVCQEKLIQT